MKHRLIVTADDFGACNFIDNGIKDAIKAGVVSSVAAMVNFEPRNKKHPYGAYKGSIKAIRDLKNEIENDPAYAKNRKVRIGLHFNFHAGTPAYPHQEKVKSLLNKKVTIAGKQIFKTIEKFNPDRIKKKEVIKELFAQYSKFYESLGFPPDHLSSHFPIVFMTPEYFEMVCMLSKPLNIPIRNPFLVWQNKNDSKGSPNRAKLQKTKKFFKKKTKTKHLDLSRAIKLIDTLDETILNGWKRKNIAIMKKHDIPFPDYVNCHLYGNGSDKDCVNNILNNLLNFHPEWYGKSDSSPVVTEVITHVGRGSYNPLQVPSGIDEGYFNERKLELESITKNKKLIQMKLHNYTTAFK